MSREQILKTIDQKKPVLEIGPLYNPLLSKDQYNVYYADIRSKDELYNDYIPQEDRSEDFYKQLTSIDYIITDTYEQAVNGKSFSAIVSCHVLEHIPDIIGHLIDLYNILDEGGSLVLIIPDKRYTFDHYREVTPFREAMEVYLNPESGILPRLVHDCSFNYHSCNNPVLYHSNLVPIDELYWDEMRHQTATENYISAKKALPVTNHYWVFTYLSFIAFIRDGLRSKMLHYSCRYNAPPELCGNEFYIVLKKDRSIRDNDDARFSEIIKLQEIIDIQEGFSKKEELNLLYDFCVKHESLFIYGVGEIGLNTQITLVDMGVSVDGFVVSDGHIKASSINGYPVYCFSEFLELQRDNHTSTGIFIALNAKNRAEVVESLRINNCTVYQNIY